MSLLQLTTIKRKVIFLLGLGALLLPVLSPLTKAQEQFSGKEEDIPFSSARIFSKVIQKIGLNPNADWFQTFGTTNQEDVGKDLYMVIYSKVQDQPRQQANKEVAERYGISEADLVRIRYNDYGPLLRRKPQIRQEELQTKINEIRNTYDTTLDILEMKARLKAKVEVSEIFANGDLDDSGFDLINDLHRIEEILFLETNPIDVGHPYKTPSQQAQQVAQVTATEIAAQQSGNNEATGGSQQNIEDTSTNANQENQGLGNSGSELNTTNNTNVGTSFPLGSTVEDSMAALAAACAPENQFDTALQQFEQTAQEDERYIDLSNPLSATNAGGQQSGPVISPPPPQGPSSGQSSPTQSPQGPQPSPAQSPQTQSPQGQPQTQPSSDEPAASSGQTPTSASEDFLPAKSDPAASGNTQPATGDVWKIPNDCDDVFCLQVNLVKKPATSSFSDADNCISCHIQHINDEMKHVLDHTLTPNKVPGNLMEPAKCKNALAESFSSISMNIYSIGMPIKTPPNDELIGGTSVEEDWLRYCEASAFFPFESCRPSTGKPEDSYVPPPILEEQAAKKVLSELPEGARLEEATTRINEMVAGYIITQAEAINTAELAHDADTKVRFFQALQAEMNQMNTYFKNMSDILQSLHEEVEGVAGKQACTALKNKKACT